MYINHWSPFLLAGMGAFATVVAMLPTLRTGVGLRRWYQPLVVTALALLGLVIVAVVIVSSPWLLLGVVLVGLIIISGISAAARVSGKAGDEAVGFVQAMVNVMASDLDLMQAIRYVSTSAEFARTFPRMSEQARLIVAELDSGRRLSVAIEFVSATIPGAQRQIWEQMAILARMLETEGLTLQAQRETLRSYWEILVQVHDANEEMRRDMSQMNAAKVLFLIIVPGMNLYMWQVMDGYQQFATSIIGYIVLSIEAAALMLIFIIMSKLQEFPEVQV